MKIKVIMFDLDGTLLPMDQEIFIKAYFKGVVDKMKPIGYEAQHLVESIWLGTKAMIENEGNNTNEMVFWETMKHIYGEMVIEDKAYFDKFYVEDFDSIKNVCGYNPKVKSVIRFLKESGYRLALATNPIFPKIATQKRIKWAGFSESDFELITSYENSSYCKPNLEYYKEILKTLDVKPEECIMIGNDVEEDMVAEKLGINVFLLTNCLINKNNKNINQFPHGDFDELLSHIKHIDKD